MCKYIILLILIVTHSVWAQDPAWISKKSYQDTMTYYYIESSTVEDLEEPYAREELRGQAVQEAIRQVLGTVSNLETNTVTTEESEQVSSYSNELFPQVELKNFTEYEVFIKGDEVFFLYAWPKVDAALTVEKAKFAAKVSRNEINTSAKPNTQVSITSEPAGAEVFIDGLRWGTTPLTLNKKIAFGAHKFVIEHKLYKKSEFEEFIFDSEKNIHRILAPLELEIYFTTNPSGARIIVDGQYKGVTPISIPFLLSENTYKKSIKFEHEAAATQTIILELEKDSSRANHVEMLLKGTKVHLYGCEPKPCNFNVGKQTGEIRDHSEVIYLAPGAHVISFSKLGYEKRYVEIEVEPGVDFGLEVVHLKKVEEKKIDLGTKVKFQLGAGYASGDFPLDKSISYFGLDANLSLIVLDYIVFNGGGSVRGFEDDKQATPEYTAKANETYYGAGFTYADIKLLFLIKKKHWEVEYTRPIKKVFYKLDQRAIRLDMPATGYLRWNLEYNEFEDFKIKTQRMHGYGIGLGLEF